MEVSPSSGLVMSSSVFVMSASGLVDRAGVVVDIGSPAGVMGMGSTKSLVGALPMPLVAHGVDMILFSSYLSYLSDLGSRLMDLVLNTSVGVAT